VAIGEIGSFYRIARDVQEEVFRPSMTRPTLDLPVIIHDRDAHEQVLKILREENASEVGGVFHCFSGDLSMARECLEMGFLVSIPGTVTFPGNESLREVDRGIKTENLLLETDSPYLAPVPYRGKGTNRSCA
jgi:TatD DNase family protein